MVITDQTYLPTFEELDVEELEIGGHVLKAGAVYLGKYCEKENNEFMLCRNETKNPAKCVNEGKVVTRCTLDFFRKAKKLCFNELDRYSYCLEYSHFNLDLSPCRKTQAAMDECMLKNFNIQRPSFAYYCKPKIHETKRPLPDPALKLLVFEGTPTSPEEDNPPELLPPKYGARFWWFR